MSCKKKLLVCTKGKSCPKMGSSRLYRSLKSALVKYDLDDFYKVKKADCFDLCKFAPVVKVAPDGAIYGRLDTDDVIEIALRHVQKKKPLKKLLVGKKGSKKGPITASV